MNEHGTDDGACHYKLYRFFLHTCAIAKTEAEARRLIAAARPGRFDPLEVTALSEPGRLYVEGVPKSIEMSSEVGTFFEDAKLTDPGHEENFFRRLGRFNELLDQLRVARAATSSCPLVPSLELSDCKLLEFCYRVAHREEVDENTQQYLFSRYPKLREFIVGIRLADLDSTS
jgi:hypothetical protein